MTKPALSYLFLAIAIIAEVIGTTAMKETRGWSEFAPVMIVIIGYGVSFYFLGVVLQDIPLGLAYAIWSGGGIVLLALIGWLRYGQQPDLPAALGIACIMAGIVIINLFSKTTVGH